MRSAWLVERNRALFVCVLILFLGIATGEWVLSFLLPMIGFMAFYAFSLNLVYQWLRLGADIRETPNVHGVLGAVVKQTYRNHRHAKRVNDYLTDLLMQFNSTLEAIPDATVVLSKYHTIEWVNQSAGSLLGINNQDLNASILSLIPSTELAEFLNQSGRQSIDLPSPVDANIILSLTLVDYAEDQKLLIANDISRHYSAQKSRKLFVENVSHELRTPLTVISGYLDIIQSDDALPDYFHRPISESLNQVNYMQGLIDELLKLSLLERNEVMPDQLEYVHLAPHLSEVLSALEAAGRFGERKVESIVPPDLNIFVVKSELDGVCYNLINNAAKYSDDHSTIRIEWAEINDDYVCLSVSDEGHGIPAEHLSRLTERFYRVDKGRSRKVGGTGLGLAIVKHILERHEGHLEIHSVVDVGSTFMAYLPKRLSLKGHRTTAQPSDVASGE